MNQVTREITTDLSKNPRCCQKNAGEALYVYMYTMYIVHTIHVHTQCVCVYLSFLAIPEELNPELRVKPADAAAMDSIPENEQVQSNEDGTFVEEGEAADGDASQVRTSSFKLFQKCFPNSYLW